MSSPRPEPGLVIRYSYLWLREHLQGREEGVKDRPCVIVLTVLDRDDETQTVVVPVTHSEPDNPDLALELPMAIKRHLGMDADRSWVVLSESNLFAWPGPDLRGTGSDSAIDYGLLPPRFFAELLRRFRALETTSRSAPVRRTE